MNRIQTPVGVLEVDDFVDLTSSIKLSRLYGFGLDASGTVISISAEQEIIREVIETISKSDGDISNTIAAIVDKFSKIAIRNRSSKRWIPKTIAGLVRPIYGGKVKTEFGFLDSENYPAIVPWKTVARALENLRTTPN